MSAAVVAFWTVAGVLLVTTVLGWLRLGSLRLASSIGLASDGLLPGTSVLEWSGVTSDGETWRSRGGVWHLLIFGDHSLQSFPSTLQALDELLQRGGDLEIIVLCPNDPALTHYVLDAAGLGVLPSVAIDQRTLRQFNVRVFPFAFIVDPDGLIGGSCLAYMSDALLSLVDRAHLLRKAGEAYPRALVAA